MDIEKLIEQLNGYFEGKTLTRGAALDSATALSTIQAENAEMQQQLNEFSEFLCHMTGGLLSKTNYTAQEMIAAADDYQQKVCGECDLRGRKREAAGRAGTGDGGEGCGGERPQDPKQRCREWEGRKFDVESI